MERTGIPKGTIYTVLAQLERQGWVRSRRGLVDGHRTRPYRITLRGETALARFLDFADEIRLAMHRTT